MDEAIRAEADALVSFLARTEGRQFELFRVAARGGVAVAFYRRTDISSHDEPTLLGVVLDEESPGQWEALGGSEMHAGGSRSISGRPSERGDWIIAIYGSAPIDASVAIVDHDGAVRRVPVEDGVYAFMTRAESEPEPTLTKPRFE